MPKRVLITGVGGFIGSHCVEYLLHNTDWNLLGIDSFRHKGDYGRLEHIPLSDRFKIFHHDLSCPITQQLYNRLTDTRICSNGITAHNKIDCILNIASDSAVERSTQDPVSVLRNNYELVINMLELARKIKPKCFLQVSTDEVYGESSTTTGHTEWDIILPSNPYAASKAAQEAVCIAYWRTYDVPVVITNTMNIIGERQDPEKFLPKIVQKILLGQMMPIYGDSVESIGSRVYMDVKNKADALLYLINRPVALYSAGAKCPDRWNICGDNEYNNLEFAHMVAKLLNKELKYKLIPSESARPGYDRRYMLNGTKLKEDGWLAPISFEDSLNRIVKDIAANEHWLM